MADDPGKQPKAEAVVRVRSNARRPLSFSCGGRTFRLAPGEERELPAWWMTSAELQHLRSAGLVLTQGPAETAPPARATPGAPRPTEAAPPAEDTPPRKPPRRKED